MVTWRSDGQDGGYGPFGNGYGLYGQRYDASGAMVGVKFQVDAHWQGVGNPSVASITGGGFVVTWMKGTGNYANGVRGQRYDAAGATVGAVFQINTYTTGYQNAPSVTGLTSGGFVVTWQSYPQDTSGQDSSGSGIYGQLYDAAGATIGAEFQINTYMTNSQSAPSAAALTDGGFVATWNSYSQDGDSAGIYGQRYNATGATVGAEFQVSTYTTNSQSAPSAAALTDGGFVVTWNSYSPRWR